MNSIFRSNTRSRRFPQPQPEQQSKEQAFFAQSGHYAQNSKPKPFFQAKPLPLKSGKRLEDGKPCVNCERQADAVADTIVNHNAGQQPVVQRHLITPLGGAGSLQRLATPEEEKMPSTNDARMEEDKRIQEKPIQKMEAPGMKEVEKPVQTMGEPGKEEEKPVQTMGEVGKEGEEPVQAKSQPDARPVTTSIGNRLSQKEGSGTPLPKDVKSEMEHSFGVDFSAVNIHTDTDAIQMNRDLHAQAFTHGKDVYFNEGKFTPENSEGKRLLAHELTHVVQQNYTTLGRKGSAENTGKQSLLSVHQTTVSPKMIQKTSTTDAQGVTWYSTKAEAEANVPTHVSPSSCFVWNGGGPAGHQWRVIPGTGCAHWVAHELGIMGTPGCYLGNAIRVSQVTAGRTQYALANAQVGDIWTNADGSHTGLVRTLNINAAGTVISVQVEHCSSGQGGVVTSTFSSGLFYR